MGLKDIYLALEDRYYDVIDALHLGKLVDPIDKVVPSFAVLLAVVLLLLLGGVYIWYTGQPTTPPTPNAFMVSLTFRGPQNEPISNAPVQIVFADQTQTSKTTTSQGKISLNVKAAQSPIQVSLAPQGYKSFQQSIPITKDEILSFKLEALTLSLQNVNRTLIVQDDQGIVLGDQTPSNITVKFSCSQNALSRPEDVITQNGEISVSYLEDCGTLVARIIASGFEEKTTQLTQPTTTVKLTPSQVVQNPTGQIGIVLRNLSTNAAISGAQVRLYQIQSSGVEQLVNQGLTDASGTFLFTHLGAGQYYVSATQTGFVSKQSPSAQLNSGQTLNLTLTLTPSTNNKKFFVRVLNASNTPIPQATVNQFLQNPNGKFILSDTDFTDSNGQISSAVGDVNHAVAALVITHPNYITQIISDAPLVGQNDANPFIVTLDAVTLNAQGLPTNGGNAEVKVSNEVQFPVSNATAKLFAGDANGLLIGSITTNAVGVSTFTNLPSGAYQATARLNNQFGTSAILNVANAQKKNFPITITTGQGGIQIQVTDAATHSAIASANVAFYDVSNNQSIFTVQTGTDGIAQASFDANRNIYAVIQKQNYFSLTTVNVPVQAGNITTLPATLQSTASIPGLGLDLVSIRDAQFALATSLQVNQTYNAEFRLTIPSNATSPIKTHVRTGSETGAVENLDQAQDVINIQQLTSASGVTQLSSTLNPADAFAVPSPTSTDAKLANTTFNSLGAGQYQFFARIKIKSTAVNGQNVKVRFQAIDTSTLTTSEFVRNYVIGQPLAQNPYGFSFFIKKVGESASTQIDETQTTPLIRTDTYQLDFSVINSTNDTYNSSQNPTLQFAPQGISSLFIGTTNPPTSSANVPFIVSSLTGNGAFGPGQTASSTLYLQPQSVLSLGTLHTELLTPPFTGSLLQRARDLRFSVAAEGAMQVNVTPTQLTPAIVNTVNIGIQDAVTHAPLTTAVISIYLNSLTSTPLSIVPTFSSGGLTTISLPAYAQGDTVYLVITNPDYAPQTVTLPVGTPTGGTTSAFACISISNTALNLVDGASAVLTFTSTCTQDVTLQLHGQDSVVQLPTVENNPSNNPVNTFTLTTANASKQVKVLTHPNHILGEFPIYVDARFASQSSYTNLAEIKATIAGTTGQCLALANAAGSTNPYEFTLSTPSTSNSTSSANGLVQNNCHVHVSDIALPGFISSEPTLLARSAIALPSTITSPYNPISITWNAALNYSVSGSTSGGPPTPPADVNQWKKYLSSSPANVSFVSDTNILDTVGSSLTSSQTYVYDAWYALNPATYPNGRNVQVLFDVEDRGDLLIDDVIVNGFNNTGGNANSTIVGGNIIYTGSIAGTTVNLPSGVHKITIKHRDADGGDDWLYVNFDTGFKKLSQLVDVMAGQSNISVPTPPPSPTGPPANLSDSGSGVILPVQPMASVVGTFSSTFQAGIFGGIQEGSSLSPVASPNLASPTHNQWAFTYTPVSGTTPGTTSATTFVNDTTHLHPNQNAGQGYWDWVTYYYINPTSFPNGKSVALHLGGVDDDAYVYLDDTSSPPYYNPHNSAGSLANCYYTSGGANCNSTITLPAGVHKLRVRLVDYGGNESLDPVTWDGIKLSQGVSAIDADPAQMYSGAPTTATTFSLSHGTPSAPTTTELFANQEKVYSKYLESEADDAGTLPFQLVANGFTGSKYVVMSASDYARTTPTTPPLKIIAVIDKSSSFQGQISNICSLLLNVKTQLQQQLFPGSTTGNPVTMEIYLMGSPNGFIPPANCSNAFTGNQITFTGTDWPITQPFDAANDDGNEAWGPAVIHAVNDAASSSSTSLGWNASSTNILFLFTDNDPTGANVTPASASSGGTSYWHSYEPSVADQTTAALAAKNAHAFVFYGSPETSGTSSYGAATSNDVIELLNAFGASNAGFTQAFNANDNPALLATRISQYAIPKQTQAFSVKVTGQGSGTNPGTSNLCYGPEGIVGYTNAPALPRIAWKWDFSSFDSTSCDASNPNGVYCDGAQFMIYLFNKLHAISTAAEQGNLSSIPSYVSFDARMIQDGFSADMLQDFLHDYRTGGPFGQSLGWFVGASGNDINFSQYLQDPTRMQFNVDNGGANNQLANSGVYHVTLSFTWDASAYDFFTNDGQANAHVVVNITPAPAAQQEALNSPLYSLPFDGELGYNPATQQYERNGYGADYVATAAVPISLSTGGTPTQIYSSNSTSSAYQHWTVFTQNDFQSTNLSPNSRGRVLKIEHSSSGGSNTLTYIPSSATPMSAHLQPTNGSVKSNYYFIREAANGSTSGGTILSTGSGPLNYWKPYASTQTIANPSNAAIPFCASLNGGLLNASIPDATATSAGSGNYCVLLQNNGPTASQAYGFSYPASSITSPNGEMEFQTVFYTPEDKSYTFNIACQSPPAGIQFRNSTGTILGQSLSPNMGYTDATPGIGSITSLSKILQLVQNGYVCINTSSTFAEFFWNHQRLLDTLSGSYGASSGFPLANTCSVV